jgi:hypothetical protein
MGHSRRFDRAQFAPGRHRQGAELRGVGAELIQGHRDDGAGRYPNVRPLNREFRQIRVIERLDGAADDFSQVRSAPARLQQQIVRQAERQQPAFDRLMGMLRARGIAKALGGNPAHRRKRVPDADDAALPESAFEAYPKLHAWSATAAS